MKSFRQDLDQFLERLRHEKPFTFSKYADGEFAILVNKKITNCDNWTFDPSLHAYERKALSESFTYKGKNYLVGISCPCCVPPSHVQWMRENVGSKHVTWANLFVNSNYDVFKKEAIPIFDAWSKDVTLVANEQGLNKQLPFKVTNYIPITIGSWFAPYLDTIVDQVSKLALSGEGQLFLFSGGPLGNILCHKLHKLNPNNTYLDIGSTINPWIVGNNRGYLSPGNGNKNKVCIW
jgi:hypothetical protein